MSSIFPWHFDVSQPDKSELKEEASLNISTMFSTRRVSLRDRSELKEVAPSNKLSMLVTLEVFHLDKSLVNF